MACPGLTYEHFSSVEAKPKSADRRNPIGNRITSHKGTETRSYTTNNLNQYTDITSGGTSLSSPSYDDDGNMTATTLSSGDWTYTWNAENRLISAENNVGASPRWRITFTYDFMCRRVEKKTYTGSPGSWTLQSRSKFVYDGYLQIEELDGADSNALLKTRVWSGAEGYDRLIAETHIDEPSVTYYALADANKNITVYLDASGNLAAHFEYSPFGQITRETGTLSNEFDFRFSSEVFEQETGLVYYNFRYYSPELGRWLKRDPIGERGGFNLYWMLENNAMDNWDWMGLLTCEQAHGVMTEKGCCCDDIVMDPRTQCCEGGEIKSYNPCKCLNIEFELTIPGMAGTCKWEHYKDIPPPGENDLPSWEIPRKSSLNIWIIPQKDTICCQNTTINIKSWASEWRKSKPTEKDRNIRIGDKRRYRCGFGDLYYRKIYNIGDRFVRGSVITITVNADGKLCNRYRIKAM